MKRFTTGFAAMAAAFAFTACSGGGSSTPVGGGPSPSPSATASAGPTASPTVVPTVPPGTPAGAWVLGTNRDSNGADPTPRLKRFDTAMNVVTEISGANAHFFNYPAGLATDLAGNVYVLESRYSDPTNSIDMFAPSQSGNVAPLASTTFPATENKTFAGGRAFGLTLDGAGNGYYIDADVGAACTVYRVPLTGGASTVTPVADCTSIIHPDAYHEVVALHLDVPRDRLYISASAGMSTVQSTAVARYDRQPDGTFAVFGKFSFPLRSNAEFAFDRNGNIVINTTGSAATPIGVYSASAFVAGQTVTPPPLDQYPGNAPETVDPSGNLFSEALFAAAGIQVFRYGDHTPSATNTFNAIFMAPVTH